MERNSCKNRNDMAGPSSIDVEWHVCHGDTFVHKLQKLTAFMSETGHQPESFLDRIIFASMFDDVTNWESRKVQDTCPAPAKEVATYAGRFRPGCWCFCAPGSENLEIQRRTTTSPIS